MRLGVTPLVVDDTNMRLCEMKVYSEMARIFRYKVIVVHPATFNPNWPSRSKQDRGDGDTHAIEMPVRLCGNLEAFNGSFDSNPFHAHSPFHAHISPPSDASGNLHGNCAGKKASNASKNIFCGFLGCVRCVVPRVRTRTESADALGMGSARTSADAEETPARDQDLWNKIVTRAAERHSDPEDTSISDDLPTPEDQTDQTHGDAMEYQADAASNGLLKQGAGLRTPPSRKQHGHRMRRPRRIRGFYEFEFARRSQSHWQQTTQNQYQSLRDVLRNSRAKEFSRTVSNDSMGRSKSRPWNLREARAAFSRSAISPTSMSSSNRELVQEPGVPSRIKLSVASCCSGLRACWLRSACVRLCSKISGTVRR